jgi:hypothetical protein
MYSHFVTCSLFALTWSTHIYEVASFFIRHERISANLPYRPLVAGVELHSTASRRKLLFPIFISKNDKNENENNNFLQDMFQSAFANDRELLSQSNKRIGMLDEGVGGDDDDDVFVVLNSISSSSQKGPELTPIQQAWRQKMMPLSPSQQTIQVSDFIDTSITMDLYLSGVPNKDPSNDLYASKTNISLRDRSVGQVLPTVPTISSLKIKFLLENKCAIVTKTPTPSLSSDDDTTSIENETSRPTTTTASDDFVNTNVRGDWKLSENGKQIRFRIQVFGFQRTIQTRGTIQKIYWSKEQDSITETSTLYSIPEGWLYFETELSKRSNGSVQWTNPTVNPSSAMRKAVATTTTSTSNGMIKIEQATGFLGIASRMVPCGKFMVTASS